MEFGDIFKHAMCDVSIIAKFVWAKLVKVSVKLQVSDRFHSRLDVSHLPHQFASQTTLYNRCSAALDCSSWLAEVSSLLCPLQLFGDVDFATCWRLDAIETSKVILNFPTVFLFSMLILVYTYLLDGKSMDKK